jgi:hypothetical protein
VGKQLSEQVGGYEIATWLALSYEAISRFDDALALAMRVRAETKDPFVLALLVPAYVSGGKIAEARAIVDEVKTLGHPYLNAIALDAIGEVDEALFLLEKIVADHSDRAVFLKVERFSARLRSSERFQALLAKVGIP